MDTDYDKTITFWNGKAGCCPHISRQECIGDISLQQKTRDGSTRVFHKPADGGNTEIRFADTKEKPKNVSSHSTCSKARKALVDKFKSQGIKRSEAEFAVNVILDNKYNRNYKQKVHDRILEQYGYRNGKRIYRNIYRLLPKQSEIIRIA